MSILLCAKSAAYKKLFDPTEPFAKPVYAAPPGAVNKVTALVIGLRPPFQPSIVPASVLNRKTAGCVGVISKDAVPLKICPVGPGGPGGVFTTSAWGWPAPL